MTWVDLVVLGVLAVSALLAFMRGLVREVLGPRRLGRRRSLAGVWALPRVRPQFQRMARHLALDRSGRLRASCSSSRLIVLLLISRWIGALVRASPIGGLDRTLGLVFGLARGAALVVIAYIVAGWCCRSTAGPSRCWRRASLPYRLRRRQLGGGQLPPELSARTLYAAARRARRPPRTRCCTRPRKAGRSAGRPCGIRRVSGDAARDTPAPDDAAG